MEKLFYILCISCLSIQVSIAQNLMHAKPLELNNGLAGSKKFDRVSFHFNQISNESNNSYFSYDRLVKPLGGGIGVFVTQKSLSHSSDLLFTNSRVSKMGIAYSPKFIVKKKVLISPSIGFSYARNIQETNHKVDEVTFLLVKRNYIDYFGNKVGILINSSKGYIGYEHRTEFGEQLRHQHSFQLGYIHKLHENQNVLLDVIYNKGEQLENSWRTYDRRINIAHQYGILYTGFGINDLEYLSALLGVRLINLKLTAAYHILKPEDFSNIEMGVQYIFNKKNKEKLRTPFRKWFIQIKNIDLFKSVR